MSFKSMESGALSLACDRADDKSCADTGVFPFFLINRPLLSITDCQYCVIRVDLSKPSKKRDTRRRLVHCRG